MVVIELDRLAHGLFEGADAGVAVLMEDPGLQRHAGGRAEGARRRTARRRCCSARWRWAPIASSAWCGGRRPGRSLPQQAVGDHLVLRRGGDDEFAGGLVVRMVDRSAATGAPGRASSG